MAVAGKSYWAPCARHEDNVAAPRHLSANASNARKGWAGSESSLSTTRKNIKKRLPVWKAF
jgi:hypothetical protein